MPLEISLWETTRGFESHPLRHAGASDMQACSAFYLMLMDHIVPRSFHTRCADSVTGAVKSYAQISLQTLAE